MKKIISYLIIIIIFLNINNITLKAQNINFDILIGINPDSLYSYKIGALIATKGEAIWIKIVDENNRNYIIRIYSPSDVKIKEIIINSNIAVNIYAFNNNEFGIYKISIYDIINRYIDSAFVNYTQEKLIITEFYYEYGLKDSTLNVSFEMKIPSSNFFSGGDFYATLLYPDSLVNNTNSLVSVIAGEEAQRRIERLGFSVLEQIIQNGAIMIKPMIYNASLNSRVYNVDSLEIKAYYQSSFYKLANNTAIITNVPNYLENKIINNFKINTQYIAIQLNNYIRNGIINISINYSNSSPYLTYQYSTKFLIYNMKMYQVLKINYLTKRNNNTITHIYGSLYINLRDIMVKYNLDILKNSYLAIISEKEGIYDVLLTKFDQKISTLKIFDNNSKKFINDFKVILQNGLSSTLDDIAYLIYNSPINNYLINITGAIFPSYIITNTTIKDFQQNIINNTFYKLDLLIIIEGNNNIFYKDLKFLISYNNMTIFNVNSTYASLSFTLPTGIYKIFIEKEGYTNYNNTIILDSDKKIIINLYLKRDNNNNTTNETPLLAFLIFVLLLHLLINTYLYRKVRRVK